MEILGFAWEDNRAVFSVPWDEVPKSIALLTFFYALDILQYIFIKISFHKQIRCLWCRRIWRCHRVTGKPGARLARGAHEKPVRSRRCNAETVSRCHWATGKAGQVMKQSQKTYRISYVWAAVCTAQAPFRCILRWTGRQAFFV